MNRTKVAQQFVSLDLEALAQVSGGMRWGDWEPSSNIEDMRMGDYPTITDVSPLPDLSGSSLANDLGRGEMDSFSPASFAGGEAGEGMGGGGGDGW